MTVPAISHSAQLLDDVNVYNPVILSKIPTVFHSDKSIRRKIYASDGRIKIIEDSETHKWLSVGWYTSPPITVYAADGRTKTIGKNDLEAYKKVRCHAHQHPCPSI